MTFRKIAIALAIAIVGTGAAVAQNKVSVEAFDRALPGFTADNNYQTKLIQAQAKKDAKLDVTFVTVPRTQEVDKLNLLMASGEAPDISFTYAENVITKYIKDGGLVELGPLLDKYGPNIKKYAGPDLLSYGQWGGKQWAIPAKRVMTAAFAAFIRKDWLDKLGMAMPKTTDEFYKTMVAFKQKDPGNTGGKVIPFAMWLDEKNIDWYAHMLLESFKQPISEEDRYCLNYERWVIPGYKEGMRFLNKMYNEGLISPDFALDRDGKQYERDVVQGKVGAFINNYDNPYRQSPGWQAELTKNVSGGLFIPFDPFVNSQGKHVKMKYNPNGLFLVVPVFNKKNAVNAIKYLDWMASKPDLIKQLENGEKGIHYLDEKDGIPMNRIPFDKLPDDKKFQWADFSIIVNGYDFGSEEKNIQAASFGYAPYEEYYKQAYKIAMADASFIPRFDVIIENEAKYRPTLNQKGADIFVKSIVCKPAEFDALYDAMVKEYMDMGGQKIVDEKRVAYKAMTAAKGKKK
jgi:putative aldouronate transport system substrate-binding protein